MSLRRLRPSHEPTRKAHRHASRQHSVRSLLADRGYDADWLLAARGGMICSSVPVIRYSDKRLAHLVRCRP